MAVARAPRVLVEGVFHRHVSSSTRTLSGSASGGRWGPPALYSVLYLGRPEVSVTVEAYRHLVDPFAEDGLTGDMVQPRNLLTCEVRVTNVLDLRTAEAAVSVGLSSDDLMSDVDDYAACQRVARAAHQLELHGILAPAATGLGETLALFERHLPAEEIPVLMAIETWPQLPADPRRLRLVGEQEA